jgi:ribosome-associated toxin RatA of RatAB toxin-antitoxin module
MGMGRTILLCLQLATMAAGARAADFELTAAEAVRVSRGETVIRADLDAAQRSGTVRAAMVVNAPPAVVFQAMTRCEDALEYVPHLRRCQVLPTSGPGDSRLVEHEIDFGWYAPRIRYVFRADVVTDRRIDFRQVQGDFKANHGVWEFEPQAGDAERTLVRYRVEIDPPGYVPDWLARSTLNRELPRMLTGLKRHCEAEPRLPVHANNLTDRLPI